MTNAFELACSKGHKVPGSRGSFKQASIVTMGVLRDSRSTLLAMLEAFIYDPLLSWTPHDGSDAAPITGKLYNCIVIQAEIALYRCRYASHHPTEEDRKDCTKQAIYSDSCSTSVHRARPSR
jgi:phosphatidylinositol kinase/protein kinase (PI-3  family)